MIEQLEQVIFWVYEVSIDYPQPVFLILVLGNAWQFFKATLNIRNTRSLIKVIQQQAEKIKKFERAESSFHSQFEAEKKRKLDLPAGVLPASSGKKK